jgi:hypothetical protein
MQRSLIRWLTFGLVALPMHAECCKDSVAIVAQLSGTATARPADSRERGAIHLFDWLGEGTTLEVGKQSRAIVILSNGHRYAFGPGSKAVLYADKEPKLSGDARELPALPPIPKPSAIATESASTSGAGRIRGAEVIQQLYPRAGMAVLADKVMLRFSGIPEATSYRLAIDDSAGNHLWSATTESAEVWIPTGVLKAGERYAWQVRAMRSGVLIALGVAEFSTLPAEEALKRTAFANALSAAGDPASVAVLAGVDLRLGLIREAIDEFSAALNQKPGDVSLQRALDSARATMAADVSHGR